MARTSFSDRKNTFPLTKAQKGMRILGIFHYALGIFLFLLFLILAIAGPEAVGASTHERHSPAFEFLDGYDNWVTGASVMTMLFIPAAMEIFIGWSCRRKSTRPEKLLLTLVLSGIGILTSLFSLFKTGSETAMILNSVYTLALNLITFLLAFKIRQSYYRTPDKILH